MSKQSKPIPPPTSIADRSVAEVASKYPVPFSLAERPRMLLNFLAVHSNIPKRYREIIAILLDEYNKALAAYLIETYGEAGAHEANIIAIAMAEGFLESIQEERESEEANLFDNLEGEVFGNP